MNVSKHISDEDITQAIKEALQVDETVPSHQIDVQTSEGIVNLSGSVPTLQAKERALELVETIRGVRAIINQIVVNPITRSDAEIQEAIVAALFFDPATHASEITVTVEDGVATLSGIVESWQKRTLCGWVTKGVKGLREVKNEIIFTYQEDRPDDDIELEVKRRLERDVWVGDALINVQAEAGKVSLTGVVGSVAEKSRAYFDAWVSGVTEVDVRELSVEWRERKRMVRESKYAPKTDEEIRQAVEDAFHYDPRIASLDLEVAVNNGTAILTGVVDNLMAKRAAGQNAGNTIGVRRVENYLQVRPVNPPNDLEIAQNVREVFLWSSEVDRHPIVVSCHDGKIYLDGTVDSNYEKFQAEDVACRVRGVVAIENDLKVDQTQRWKSDQEIKQDIERQFRWSSFLEPDQIEVNVEDGVTTLTGSVDTRPQHNALVMKAMKGGAKKVISHLRIQSAPIGTDF